jgi:SNF2 family DNA or RNA helicase
MSRKRKPQNLPDTPSVDLTKLFSITSFENKEEEIDLTSAQKEETPGRRRKKAKLERKPKPFATYLKNSAQSFENDKNEITFENTEPVFETEPQEEEDGDSFSIGEVESQNETMMQKQLPEEEEFIKYLSKQTDKTLYPHQIQAIRWMFYLEMQKITDGLKKNIGGVLGDDMGMGKTLTGLCKILYDVFLYNNFFNSTYQKYNSYFGTTIIVTTLTLLDHWKMEAMRIGFTQSDIMIFRGPNRERMLKTAMTAKTIPIIILTTYGTLKKDAKNMATCNLFKIGARRVVLDEAHIVRNGKTNTTQALQSLNLLSFFCFTGTPFVNSENDIFTLSAVCTPSFKINKRFVSNSKQNLVDIWKSKYFISRKKELIADLPPKTEKDLWIDFESQKSYDRYRALEKEALDENFKYKQLREAYLESMTTMPIDAPINPEIKEIASYRYQKVLSQILRLRQYVDHPIIFQKQDVTSSIRKNTLKKYNAKNYEPEISEQLQREIAENRKKNKKSIVVTRRVPETDSTHVTTSTVSITEVEPISMFIQEDIDEESLIAETEPQDEDEEESSEENDDCEIVYVSKSSSPVLISPQVLDTSPQETENNNINSTLDHERIMEKVFKMQHCTENEKRYLSSLTIDEIPESEKQSALCLLYTSPSPRD